MSGATEGKGESPVAHARCGLPPRTNGATVFCPSCFDVCTKKSLREAVCAWNHMQQQIICDAEARASTPTQAAQDQPPAP